MNELDLTADLDTNTVRAGVSVGSWEEAVEEAGALLVGGGAAEPEYIEAMKGVFTEHGSYAVIAPGIAMPHARPEQGVLRAGMALITLADPVDFGHADNDPVDLVVAFCAVDKSTHVKALQQLAQLLGDERGVTRMRAATSDAALVESIRHLLTQVE